MGFFSWDCKLCGHPMLSPYSTNKANKWMSRVVVYLSPKSGALKGTYDGYGRVENSHSYEDEDNLADVSGPCCYHHACWEAAGKPKYTGPSRDSADQGYFFNDPTHNMPKPKTAADLPKKPVNYSAVAGVGAAMGMTRSLWDTDEKGNHNYVDTLHGPWHPMTRKLAKALVMQRLWRQVVRKFRQGHTVPAIQDLEDYAASMIG